MRNDLPIIGLVDVRKLLNKLIYFYSVPIPLTGPWWLLLLYCSCGATPNLPSVVPHLLMRNLLGPCQSIKELLMTISQLEPPTQRPPCPPHTTTHLRCTGHNRHYRLYIKPGHISPVASAKQLLTVGKLRKVKIAHKDASCKLSSWLKTSGLPSIKAEDLYLSSVEISPDQNAGVGPCRSSAAQPPARPRVRN